MENKTETVTNHWWWRPGWGIGKRYYTWHFTFKPQEPLKEMISKYQTIISGLPNYDLVPFEWLHLTTQGIGFVDQFSEGEVDEIVQKVKGKLLYQERFSVLFNPPEVYREAISCPITPVEALNGVRTSIRESISEVLGNVSEPEVFHPHVSLAYSNAEGVSKPIVESIKAITANSVNVEISNVDLIRLGRDKHLYEWGLVSRVDFTNA